MNAMEGEVAKALLERDRAYAERNRLVAFVARLYPSGIRPTNIEGWDPCWHNCVFVDSPAGQLSWHYHDDERDQFEALPPYTKPWDEHTTEEKYARLERLPARSTLRERVDCLHEALARVVREVELLDPGWAPPALPDLPDVEACSCDEALALRAELATAQSEAEFWKGEFKRAVRERVQVEDRLAETLARREGKPTDEVSTCTCCGQLTDRAQSSAPVVSLLRILELCWRERARLPADLVERIREQLEGPLAVRAKADIAVLEALAEVPQATLERTNALGDYAQVAFAELGRREVKP
jgi:hypothetical protein